MYTLAESYFSQLLKLISDKAKVATEYCKNATEEVIERTIQKSQPLIEKTKEFYNQHQKVILVATTAAVVYLVFGGKKKKEEDKPKKKKQIANKIQVSSKIFVSDVSAEEYKEQPSTTVRVESSGKQMLSKKRVPQRVLQRIQSSSEQQQAGDKIFFEMYKKYQNSE